jgi:FMN phosphatase YigB (HAD superfamily)
MGPGLGNMIKAVLFDFGQTLVDSSAAFRGAEKTAQHNILTDLQLTDAEGFLAEYRRIRRQFKDRSEASRVHIWSEVYRHFGRGVNVEQLKAWEADYWRTVADGTSPFPETMRVLEALRKQYRLGMVTNAQGAEGCRHRLGDWPQITDLFDSLIIAGQDGMPAKPAREPFDACLAALCVPPDKAIFVGDDYRADMEGAIAAGISPIWLKHHLAKRNWPDVAANVPVITNLSPLLGIGVEGLGVASLRAEL